MSFAKARDTLPPRAFVLMSGAAKPLPMLRRAFQRILAVMLCILQLVFGISAAVTPTYGQPAASANDPGVFQIRPGFRIELVAAEPLVESPVALAFDEKGRLFVAEMRDNPDHHAERPLVGRIRVLDDTNGSGVYNSSTIYADDLAWPSAVACYGGGVFVAVTPDIIYLKDKQANGVADVNQVVFSGFGSGANTNEIQTGTSDARPLLNSFQWALDNRIHGVTAGLGGIVTALGSPGAAPISLKDAVFCFDPRTRAMYADTGTGQSGLTFDNGGRRFVCDFTRPLKQSMYDLRYFARNPFFPRPPEMIDVASPATPIFRFAGMGPPRAADGRRPSSVLAAGPPTGRDMLAAGWLAAARGAVIYRGGAFPPAYLENAFIPDPEAHIIHRAILRENGLEVVAERAPDESKTEFLVSRDPAFRPVQIINGPGGALYVADQREGAGGRIYRIVPANFRPGWLPQPAKAATYQLVATLAHPNAWHRETVARLLYERQDKAAPPLLASMLNRSRLPLARLQALQTLAGLGALKEEHVITALADEDARVREHAVLLAEKLASNGAVSDALWEQLRSAAADPDVRVRFQLAFTLGEIRRPEKDQILSEMLERDLDNPWMQAAVQSSVGAGAADVFVRLATEARFRRNPAGLDALRQFAEMIGVMAQTDPVKQVVNFIDRTPLEPEAAFGLIYAFGDGLHRAGSSLDLADPDARLQRFYAQAALALINNTLLYPRDIEVIRLLSVSPYKMSDGSDWLTASPGSTQPQGLQAAAIAGLRYSDDPRLGTNLLARWPSLSSTLRSQAVSTLLARSTRVGLVLAALEDGRIRSNEVSSTDANLLRTYSDAMLTERAIRLLGPLNPHRPEVAARFGAALGLTGDAAHGREIFVSRCSSCHRLGGEGQALGPNLAGAKIKGRKSILESILEPSAEVRPGYETDVLKTKAGEIVIGLANEGNLTTVTVRQPEGNQAVWPRDNIESSQPQTWSLMPDGLEDGLTEQDMADLLDFVMTTGDR